MQPNDGFDPSAQMVIFQTPKGQKRGQIWLFCYFLTIFSKKLFCIQIFGDNIDQQSRDGFD